MMNRKKFLTAAITMSLVLGTYGVAGAKLYLYGSNISTQTVDGATPNSTTTGVNQYNGNDFSAKDTTPTGANYTVIGGKWNYVYGGYAASGNVGGTDDEAKNTVTINCETKISNIYGGYAKNGDAIGNIVKVEKISSDTVNGVYGGYADDTGGASNNEVTINSGTFKNIYGGRAHDGTASENKVTISGSTTVNNYIYGGWSKGKTGNNATDNTVTIEDGTIKGSVYGGSATSGDATGNTVNISGGTISDEVYGGYSKGSGTVSNNTVNISGTANVSGATLYGYNVSATSHTGNTLNIAADWTGGNKIVKSIKNFESVNLIIPANATNDYTMLTVTNELSLSTIGNIGIYAHPGTNLNQNDVITLIRASNCITYSDAETSVNGSTEKLEKSNDTVSTLVKENDFVGYDATVTAAENSITATINSGKHATAESKSPVETQAAGMTMLTNGGDILAGAAYDAAGDAVKASYNDPTEFVPYAVLSGSNTRINSGSYVDLKSWNISVGFAKEVANPNGSFLFGPIAEYGRGSYDSYLDNGYYGTGTTRFFGLGYIVKQKNNNNTYLEGSLRVGRIDNDYESHGGSYDQGTTYYGAHIGAGKVFQLSEKNSLDCYAKLFYTHQNEMTTQLGTAGNLDMEAINSFRSKLGFRFNHFFSAKNAMYAGLAWQNEMSGGADATLNDIAIAAPSVKGHTGILELGWKNFAAKNLEVDLGLNGYSGVQEGIGVTAKLNWKF